MTNRPIFCLKTNSPCYFIGCTIKPCVKKEMPPPPSDRRISEEKHLQRLKIRREAMQEACSEIDKCTEAIRNFVKVVGRYWTK